MKSEPFVPDLSVLDAFAPSAEKKCVLEKEAEIIFVDDFETFEAALSSTYSTSTIFRWLKHLGYSRTEQTVERHRGGNCGCRPRVNHRKNPA